MINDLQLLIIGIGGILALIVIVVGVVLTRREGDLVEERLGRFEQQHEADIYGQGRRDEASVAEEDMRGSVLQESRRFLDPVNEYLASRNFGRRWRQQLARANLKLTVAEFAILHLISLTGFFVTSYWIIFPRDLVMSTLAGIVGFFAPRFYVSRIISQRLIAFENQLPDTLSMWVNALRSGYSVLQAMEAIAREAPQPTGTEFQRVVQEVQLGIDMPDAYNHLLTRVESEDLDLVITAVNIQREVGGNLAEILEIIGHTIRERIKLKGEIRVLTAQGRITGYLISGLPIVLALFLNVISPSYMNQMFENRACGWPMIGVGLTLIGIGTAIIQKIVDIEI